MPQTLTKPVLLDETGQAIAGKLDTNSAAIVDALDDIKDAIGTSSEFIPIAIRVVTPPTKTVYKVGERLDISGIVVNLIGSNNTQFDITSACTFAPANGATLTAANTSVTVSYHYSAGNIDFSTSQTLTIRELDSIAVTTPPIKTAYQTGETLDLTGIVVTATYSDGYTANVTADCVFSPANGTVLSSSDTSVGVNYTENGVTKSTTVAIGVKELVSISVSHIPTKVLYKAGETLDLTGIVVTATYDDMSMINVTNRCTYSPDNGDVLSTSNTSILITYTEGAITKTTSQVIVVRELSSIAITTPPTKIDYIKNETLDLTGIVVTATYNDGYTEDVTSLCTYSPADGTTLTINDTAVTISYTEISITKTTTQAISVNPPIYGVEWDGTSTSAWTRTDLAADFVDPVPYYRNMSVSPSSPFDTIQPWAGMVRVTDSTVGELVAIPKFYYKLTQNGARIKIQIANEEATGFHVSPAHMDRNDGEGERDVIYVGRYHCASTNLKSLTNVKPKVAYSHSNFETNIHSLGTDIYMFDFATMFTIWLLYLVEFADWNSQEKIGYGGQIGTGVSSGDLSMKVGSTDNVPYHTGTYMTSKTTNGANEYRYIEGLWDNVYDRLGGCKCTVDGLSIYLDFNPNNGVIVGIPKAGFPTQFDVVDITGAFPMFIPSEVGGSGSVASCDEWEFIKNASYYLYMGGSTPDGGYNHYVLNDGLFRIGRSYVDDDSYNLGSRLIKLPANS